MLKAVTRSVTECLQCRRPGCGHHGRQETQTDLQLCFVAGRGVREIRGFGAARDIARPVRQAERVTHPHPLQPDGGGHRQAGAGAPGQGRPGTAHIFNRQQNVISPSFRARCGAWSQCSWSLATGSSHCIMTTVLRTL